MLWTVEERWFLFIKWQKTWLKFCPAVGWKVELVNDEPGFFRWREFKAKYGSGGLVSACCLQSNSRGKREIESIVKQKKNSHLAIRKIFCPPRYQKMRKWALERTLRMWVSPLQVERWEVWLPPHPISHFCRSKGFQEESVENPPACCCGCPWHSWKTVTSAETQSAWPERDREEPKGRKKASEGRATNSEARGGTQRVGAATWGPEGGPGAPDDYSQALKLNGTCPAGLQTCLRLRFSPIWNGTIHLMPAPPFYFWRQVTSRTGPQMERNFVPGWVDLESHPYLM